MDLTKMDLTYIGIILVFSGLILLIITPIASAFYPPNFMRTIIAFIMMVAGLFTIILGWILP